MRFSPFKFHLQSFIPSYVEPHCLLGVKQDFLHLEDSSLSLSHLEAELHTQMIVAQSSLELEIASYHALRSKYFSVISRSEDVAK